MTRKKKVNKYKVSSEFELTYVEGLNPAQTELLNSKSNLVVSGYAGTGKTFLATYVAFRDIIAGKYEKIMYIRSAVPTRDIGFLPGTDKEKLEVYEAPYIDIVNNLFERGDSYGILKTKGIINFSSTSFIRGNNLRDCVVIVDEAQNMSYHELDSIITRLNDNCRIIFCGDIRQADLFKNGMDKFYQVLKEMELFDFIDFNRHSDIVRSDLVKSYIINKERVLDKY